MGRYIFFSDVHISGSAPSRTESLLACLERWGWEHSQSKKKLLDGLFILGDLFNYWFAPPQAQFSECQAVLKAIKALTNQGIPVYFIFGNRDFLVNQYFEKTWNIYNLGEQALLRLNGKLIFLTHGDGFLKGDWASQIYRKIIQHPITKGMAAFVPAKLVHTITVNLRKVSKNQNAQRNPKAFEFDFSRLAKAMFPASVAICGHVHQERVYSIETNWGERLLYTLGDWAHQASYLELEGDTFQFQN